jgi:hypothetical protein
MEYPDFGRKQVDPKLFSGLHQSEVTPAPIWGMATILSEMGHCLHDLFTIARQPLRLPAPDAPGPGPAGTSRTG